MDINIGSIVQVYIHKLQLNGCHEVKIINGEHYSGMLITPSFFQTRRLRIYYAGLQVTAQVIRKDKYFIDLVPYPNNDQELLHL